MLRLSADSFKTWPVPHLLFLLKTWPPLKFQGRNSGIRSDAWDGLSERNTGVKQTRESERRRRSWVAKPSSIVQKCRNGTFSNPRCVRFCFLSKLPLPLRGMKEWQDHTWSNEKKNCLHAVVYAVYIVHVKKSQCDRITCYVSNHRILFPSINIVGGLQPLFFLRESSCIDFSVCIVMVCLERGCPTREANLASVIGGGLHRALIHIN